jgi:YHS domain-containing protein
MAGGLHEAAARDARLSHDHFRYRGGHGTLHRLGVGSGAPGRSSRLDRAMLARSEANILDLLRGILAVRAKCRPRNIRAASRVHSGPCQSSTGRESHKVFEEQPMSHPRSRLFNVTPHFVFWLLLVAMPLQAGVPGSTSHINLDATGLALGGYDPVAYFETGKPTRGKPMITASYDGAQYRFASKAHRQAFTKSPGKYLPQFGGFCAVGTSFGEKVDVDPKTGKVVDGKLYLNNGPKAQAIFDQDPGNTISRAEQHWPTVKDKAL